MCFVIKLGFIFGWGRGRGNFSPTLFIFFTLQKSEIEKCFYNNVATMIRQ